LNASTPPNADTGSHASALRISVQQRRLLRRTARIVVLDDDRSGILEFRGQAACRLQINKIVVRKLLALKLLGHS